MKTAEIDTVIAGEVEATVRDYFEGWYDADVDRMARALHPDLVKRSDTHAHTITKDRMLELTAAGQGRQDGLDRALDIVVIDIHGDIAAVVVRSSVYREYLHLVRTDGGWRLLNAL